MRHRQRTHYDSVYRAINSGVSQASNRNYPSIEAALTSPPNSLFNPTQHHDFVTDEVANVDMIDDELTDGYYRLVKEGKLLPINPLSMSSSERSGGLCAYAYWRYAKKELGKYSRYDAWVNSLARPAPIPSHLPNPISSQALLTEAISKWRSQGFDVLTFIAELRKTQDMIVGANHRFRQVSSDIVAVLRRRNTRFRDMSEVSDAFLHLWMEGRYGWRLLYYDLLSIQDAASNNFETLSRYNASESVTSESTSPWSSHYFYRWRTVTTTVHSARAGVIGTMDMGRVSFDPIVTAYEVIPYTIVLDWLIGLSSTLRASSPFARGTIDSTWTSLKSETTSILEVEPVQWGSYSTPVSTFLSNDSFSSLKTLTRAKVSPTYEPKILPISGLNWVDAAAMLVLSRTRLIRGLKSLVKPK